MSSPYLELSQIIALLFFLVTITLVVTMSLNGVRLSRSKGLGATQVNKNHYTL